MATKTTITTEATGWVGWGYFAAFMMMLTGTFQLLYGLVAVLNDKYFVATANHLIVFDVTTWGIIHMLVGLLVFFAGMSLLVGSTFGRTIGVIMASLSAFAAVANLALFPIWSVVVLTIDILVIYSLTAHGHELRD